MVERLYPNKLRALNLTFSEAVIAIAFDLEDELSTVGKGILTDFGSQQQMEVAVRDVLRRAPDGKVYALHRVLGDLYNLKDEQMLRDNYDTLERAFSLAVSMLKSNKYAPSYRFLLMKKLRPEAWADITPLTMEPGTAINLCAQVQQLMADVRMYDERREQALNRIEALLTEIRNRELPAGATLTDAVEVEPVEPMKAIGPNDPIDPNGPIDQLRLSDHSMKLLRRASFGSVAEAVEFFNDFENFLEYKRFTLLEWWVIQQGLRNADLLADKCANIDLSLTVEEGLSLTVEDLDFGCRTHNCLVRGNIKTLADMASLFSRGVVAGWKRISTLRNFGRSSLDELKNKMYELAPMLDESICFPTFASPVVALDFDFDAYKALESYDISTIGELLTAYRDENRCSGLRYLDETLYAEVALQLKKYGFEA